MRWIRWWGVSLSLLAIGCGEDREGKGTSGSASGRSDTPVAASPAGVEAGRSPEASHAPSKPPPREEEEVVPAGATSRWYETLQEGQKTGWIHVVWQASTWQGKPTVRDTTTTVSRSGRAMLNIVDVFEVRSVQVSERSEDGVLWWTKATVTEPTDAGPRVTTAETTWTGNGYDHVRRLGSAEPETRRIDAKEPAHVDAEALLSRRVVAKDVKEGAVFSLRQVDAVAREVKVEEVTVLGRENARSARGEVPCWKVREFDPETKSESWFWIDDEGAAVRVRSLSTELRRATEKEAKKFSGETPSFSITVPADPPLERIFAADRVLLDVKLSPDPDRPLPDFPDSPWSRVTEVKPDGNGGGTIKVELRSYDSVEKTAVIPVKDPAFARWLEPTVLMECRDAKVVAAAETALDGETDARKAVQKIADRVFRLKKKSPEVNQTSAVEILKQNKGDCSEHALLFVALCRAAGIPARQCSGYVCIGSDWGSHAWAEVWTGQWIGVDPTTCDVGTAARYLFFGYTDEPGSHPGVVSARARGRMTLVGTRLEEGKEVLDLRNRPALHVLDAKKRVASDKTSGLELADGPEDWEVEWNDEGAYHVTGPGIDAWTQARADQGYRTKGRLRPMIGSDAEEARFAGVPAWVHSRGNLRTAVVNHRRTNVVINAK